jgi:4-hydroxymandelate oxidase
MRRKSKVRIDQSTASCDSGTRREAMKRLALFAAGSPLLVPQNGAGQQPRPPADVDLPQYAPEVMALINIHDFEDFAKAKIGNVAYDYIAGGSASEHTLRANRDAFRHIQLRRRILVDASIEKMDLRLELLGKQLDFPILLAPGDGKNLAMANGDLLTAKAAGHCKAIYVGAPANWMAKLQSGPEAPIWWAASLGHPTKESAIAFARQAEEGGASAISVTVNYTYAPPADRDVHNKFENAWAETGVPKDPSGKSTSPATAGMFKAIQPRQSWDQIDWLHGATKLPVVIKGITTAEDARIAVDRGAQGIIVSNHGGRALDGMAPSLYSLPEVVDAVNGRIPVLMDGGIRRGGDVVKALALGAKAILIGRSYYWGLAAFGQIGVQRVIELLFGETRLEMAIAAAPTLAQIERSIVEWSPWDVTEDSQQ